VGKRNQIDIAGQRYNRLLGIGPAPDPRKGLTQGWFECDCGKSVTLAVSPVVRGRVKSCGCAKRDTSLASAARWKGHVKVVRLSDEQLLVEMQRRGI
jgi:hypothetical protein